MFLQHGRVLRSASVTYPYSKEPYRVHGRRLAPPHCHTLPDSEDERSSPKRNGKSVCKIPTKKPKKQLKSPTKNVKDVNDNTKHKECTGAPLIRQTVKGKGIAKNKSGKEQKELDLKDSKRDKRERPDGKNTFPKKEDTAKARPAKIDATVSDESLVRSWTREEDKTMLEVLKGEASSEQVFGRIRELLPHRSVTEIKERFCHVMNLLQQMAVGEVT